MLFVEDVVLKVYPTSSTPCSSNCVIVFVMSGQFKRCSEHSTTIVLITFVRVRVSVIDFHVIVSVSRLSERLAAVQTFVMFLSGVCESVEQQLTRVSKTFHAKLTFERFVGLV